ncbi:MAG: D-glycero-beta-D-manno-heptose 1,7-bisphosphate 7-phosphatase [Francisellaceae bacterium]
MMRVKLVILDRDGVINHDSDHYIRSADQWTAINGSLQAIRKLHDHGIAVAIATNQSGIARGFYSYAELTRMHHKLFDLLDDDEAVGYIAICPHLPEDNCQCRKPEIGMLREIADKLCIVLDRDVFFIGDSFKDIQAAERAGVTPVLVKTGKGQNTIKNYPELMKTTMIFDDLLNFVDWLL